MMKSKVKKSDDHFGGISRGDGQTSDITSNTTPSRGLETGSTVDGKGGKDPKVDLMQRLA